MDQFRVVFVSTPIPSRGHHTILNILTIDTFIGNLYFLWPKKDAFFSQHPTLVSNTMLGYNTCIKDLVIKMCRTCLIRDRVMRVGWIGMMLNVLFIGGLTAGKWHRIGGSCCGFQARFNSSSQTSCTIMAAICFNVSIIIWVGGVAIGRAAIITFSGTILIIMRSTDAWVVFCGLVLAATIQRNNVRVKDGRWIFSILSKLNGRTHIWYEGCSG